MEPLLPIGVVSTMLITPTRAIPPLPIVPLINLWHPIGRNRVYDAREPDNGNHLLPEAIAAVLERRLSRLSGNCQALLGKAAVLGGSFELGQLLPMANEFTEDVVLDLLDEALHAGLLTEEGMGTHITYHFWHPLIISHLYERLSAARRAHFHRKAAEAIKKHQCDMIPLA